MTQPRIELQDLPARLRMLADEMQAVGAAVSYFGGFGPFAEWGNLLHDQSAPMCRELAKALERMQGGRA
jgi:Na+/glutamate symporter